MRYNISRLVTIVTVRNVCILFSTLTTVQSTYNEIDYNEKSVILNRLFILINNLENISSLVILKLGYHEYNCCPTKISL